MVDFIRRYPRDVRYPSEARASDRAQKVRHLPKNVRASEAPSTYSLARSATRDALILQLSSTRMRGYISVFGITAALLAYGSWSAISHLLWPATLKMSEQGSPLYFFVPLAMMTLIGLAAAMMALRAFRLDLLTPKEIPIVFNRATRKVYEFMPQVPTLGGLAPMKVLRHWASTFKPWPMVLIEYDWDCMEAEFDTTTTIVGNVPKQLHELRMYVKESPASDRVLTSLSLMTPYMTNEAIALSFWEHIRRFMEEGGPHLSPGDEPSPPYPRNPISAMQTAVPYIWPVMLGAFIWSANIFIEHGLLRRTPLEFMMKYRGGHGAAITFIITFFFVAAGFFNWIAHLTAPDLPLPSDVLEGAGEKLDMKQLAAEAKAAAGKKTTEKAAP